SLRCDSSPGGSRRGSINRGRTMLRNARVQMAAVLAVGALLGYLAVSGRLSLIARAGGGAEPQPPTPTSPAQAPGAPAADKPPRNIIFVICDQEPYPLTARDDYKLPARQALMRHGVTFRNHYIASAMCTASRAAFLTGQPPQVTGVC